MKFTLWSLILILCMFCCFPLSAQASQDQPDTKLSYEVKAAYLLNFFRYTEWPSLKTPKAHTPLVLCILGYDPFGNILEETFKGKEITGRNLKVNRLPNAKPVMSDCHAVFISKITQDQNAGIHEALKSLEHLPVLTVADNNGFQREGVIIQFVKYEETIQFEINLKIAEKSGLKLSSRMIPLARKVLD